MLALASSCSTMADVGCDHGQIGLAFLKGGLCQRALMIDISEPSLNKARQLFLREGYGDRACFLVGDGLLPAGEAQCAVIAGMGGKLIVQLLTAARDRAREMEYLVLQPNNSLGLVRGYLAEHGFVIRDEAICFENGRHYALIRTEAGESPRLTELERELGPVNLVKRPPFMESYARHRLKVHESILRTMERGEVRGEAYGFSQRMAQSIRRYLEEGDYEGIPACGDR
jgi:tRNA (adenine22-N1)-methyltransferase